MALYVCIVLGAEFVAVADQADEEASTVGAIWGTAVGVALAHVFAFNPAARLFAGGGRSGTRRAAWAQLGAAAAVAAILSLPFLFLWSCPRRLRLPAGLIGARPTSPHERRGKPGPVARGRAGTRSPSRWPWSR